VKNMIQIDGLAEVVLNVRNAPRAVAFYGGLLGLQRLSAEGQPGPIFFRAGQANDHVPSLLVLVPLPDDAPEFAAPRTLHHLALTVPAAVFDEARSTLVEAGIEVRDGQHPLLAVRTMYVTDPDGNEVELISPQSVN
jgi:catechol 2,3-dioxygenase-like lactoylglutathione lyase family enzyme